MAFLDTFASWANRTIAILTLSETVNSIGDKTPTRTTTESGVKCFIVPNTQAKESRHRKIATSYDTIVSQYTCRLGLDHTVKVDDRISDNLGTLYTVAHIRIVSGFGDDDHTMLYLNEVRENV